MFSVIGGDRPNESELCRKRKQRGFTDLSDTRILRERNRIGRLIDVRIEHEPIFILFKGDRAMSVFAFGTGEQIGEIRFWIVRRKAGGDFGRTSRRIGRIAHPHGSVRVLNVDGVAPWELDSKNSLGVFARGFRTKRRSGRRTFGGAGRNSAHRHSCGLAAAIERHLGDLHVEFLNLRRIRTLFS